MTRRREVLKYLTPNTPADELERFKRSFCIPNDAEWLGVFMGAIFPLTKAESWELYGMVTPDEAAAIFQEIFDEAFLGIGECDDMACCPMRYSETGLVEQYNPETSEYEPIDYPPLPIRTPVEGQETKCLAAANATEVYSQLWQAWKETWDTSTFLVAVAGIITIIGLLIFYPVALPFVITFFTELYGLMTAIGADDFDSEKQEIFRCILYCASTEGTEGITYNFSQVVDEVDALWTPVTDINVWAAIHYLLLIVGEDGLNRAATTTSITSAECDCPDCAETWCYTFFFDEAQYGWNGYDAPQDARWGTAWTPHGFIYPSDPSNRARGHLYIDFPTFPAIVTSITITRTELMDGNLSEYQFANRTLYSTPAWTSPAVANTDLEQTYNLPDDTEMGGFIVYQYNATATNLPITPGIITRIVLRGLGDNPFGPENCL